jgi:hypothetical protein
MHPCSIARYNPLQNGLSSTMAQLQNLCGHPQALLAHNFYEFWAFQRRRECWYMHM